LKSNFATTLNSKPTPILLGRLIASLRKLQFSKCEDFSSCRLSPQTQTYSFRSNPGTDKVKEEIRKFKILTKTADLTDRILEKGFESGFLDFEDALQYHCALSENSTHIITRNGRHFKNSILPVMRAEEYLSSIQLV
jgi:hypothetical protein